MSSHKRGQFIVVEGLEGAGKSTAINHIKQIIGPRVSELLVTREPGGTLLGDFVRKLLKENTTEAIDPKAELLLFYAARVQLLEQVIRPALERGAWVVADRFELSSLAYQGGGRGLDEASMRHLSEFCLQGFQPDLIIFLDILPQKGMQRVHKRGQIDRIEQESEAFFERVYQSYHRHLKGLKQVKIIDAAKPYNEVQQLIRKALEEFIQSYGKSLSN